MSRPDEQLSTRDLASTPAEPREETDAADEREPVHTSSGDEGRTEAAPPTPAAHEPEEADEYRGDRDADVAEPAPNRRRPAEPAAGRPRSLRLAAQTRPPTTTMPGCSPMTRARSSAGAGKPSRSHSSTTPAARSRRPTASSLT